MNIIYIYTIYIYKLHVFNSSSLIIIVDAYYVYFLDSIKIFAETDKDF